MDEVVQWKPRRPRYSPLQPRRGCGGGSQGHVNIDINIKIPIYINMNIHNIYSHLYISREKFGHFWAFKAQKYDVYWP
jgi:hypothetical protein